jgi:hypothetical protein
MRVVCQETVTVDVTTKAPEAGGRELGDALFTKGACDLLKPGHREVTYGCAEVRAD